MHQIPSKETKQMSSISCEPLVDVLNSSNFRIPTCTAQAWGQRKSHRYLHKEALGIYRSSEYKGDVGGEPVASSTTSLNCMKRKIQRFCFSILGSVVCAQLPWINQIFFEDLLNSKSILAAVGKTKIQRHSSWTPNGLVVSFHSIMWRKSSIHNS